MPATPVKRPGRPKGAKDKKGFRIRRTKKELMELRQSAHLASALLSTSDSSKDEECVGPTTALVYLSVKQALSGPDAGNWKEALDLEEAKILAYKTWRPATAEEIKSPKRVLPIAVLLNKKRCGRFKARAVCLGNLDTKGSFDSFAPVASQVANRFLLISAAHDGDAVMAYDEENAFLGAELDRDVFVRLPECWAKKHGYSVAKLLKSLYGLRDSPRNWYNRFSKILVSLGWEECVGTPGIWRKPSLAVPGRYLKKSVYVDDNLATGPCANELKEEVNKIFAAHPGKEIAMRWITKGGAWHQEFDFLGADVCYSQEARSMKITMRSYIEKIQKKHNVTVTKRVTSPNFCEKALMDPDCKKVPGFPIREFVGKLQWISTVARPDVAVPVSIVARYVSEVPNRAIVRAIVKILKYLICTKDEGLSYNPSVEAEFAKVYSDLLPEGVRLPVVNLFSDASYANDLKTLRSTSGSIMFFRGCPIIWKSSRQTVRAYSTAESEYIAASDTIILSESCDFTTFFDPLPKQLIHTDEVHDGNDCIDRILWVDNSAAISTATSSLLMPKSRHYAMRYLRVRDYAADKTNRIVFCPTTLQKADGLTKLECSVEQRSLLLHTGVSRIGRRPAAPGRVNESDDDSVEDLGVSYSVYLACW